MARARAVPPLPERPIRGVSRAIRARLVVDGEHYDQLVARDVSGAAVSVWISTANLKTMLVEAPIGSRARARGRYVSFFETLTDLVRRGVEVRLLHASPPSGPLARELTRTGDGAVQMRRCPRVLWSPSRSVSSKNEKFAGRMCPFRFTSFHWPARSGRSQRGPAKRREDPRTG